METLTRLRDHGTADRISNEREQPMYLRITEAAQLMGLSKSKTAEMASLGDLPGVVRFGRAVRVHRGMLLAYLERLARGDAA